MKRTLIATTLLFGTITALAEDISCSQIDYAELKDMPSKDITATYCENISTIEKFRSAYAELIEAERNYISKVDSATSTRALKDDQPRKEQINAALGVCNTQQEKLLRMLKNRKVAMPDCGVSAVP